MSETGSSATRRPQHPVHTAHFTLHGGRTTGPSLETGDGTRVASNAMLRILARAPVLVLGVLEKRATSRTRLLGWWWGRCGEAGENVGQSQARQEPTVETWNEPLHGSPQGFPLIWLCSWDRKSDHSPMCPRGWRHKVRPTDMRPLIPHGITMHSAVYLISWSVFFLPLPLAPVHHLQRAVERCTVAGSQLHSARGTFSFLPACR